jgi:hypothetical protein
VTSPTVEQTSTGRRSWLEALNPDRALFSPSSERRLAAVRTGLAAVLALRLLFRSVSLLSHTPDIAFQPPPLLDWLGGMPPFGVLLAIQIVGVAAAVAAVLGRRPRITFPVAWMALLFLGGLKVALGKILHNDVPLLLCCVPFLIAPVTTDLRSRVRSERFGWPVRVAMITIAVGYWAAGYQKLQISGIDWVTGSNMRWVMYAAAVPPSRAPSTALTLFIADNAWLAHLVAGSILLLELAFPLAVVFRRLRPYAIAGVAALHIGTWLTLGLDYWGWVLTVFVVFANWDWLLDHLGERYPRWRSEGV